MQLKNAMSAMHRYNICHRDIKTSNIMLHFPQYLSDPTEKAKFFEFLRSLDLDNCDFTVKLADFGMAKEIMPGQMTATCAGTPLTMDPDCLKEQKYTAKADLFSLGVLLF